MKRAVPQSIRRILSGVAPSAYKQMKKFAVHKLMGKTPPMPNYLRDELIQYFSADVSRLQTVIGRDLSHWLGK